MNKKILLFSGLVPVFALPALTVVSCGYSNEVLGINNAVKAKLEQYARSDINSVWKNNKDNTYTTSPSDQTNFTQDYVAPENPDTIKGEIENLLKTKSDLLLSDSNYEIDTNSVKVKWKIDGAKDDVLILYDLTNKTTKEKLPAQYVVRINVAKPTWAAGANHDVPDADKKNEKQKGTLKITDLDSSIKTIAEAKEKIKDEQWVFDHIGSLVTGSHKILEKDDVKFVELKESTTKEEAGKTATLKFKIKQKKYYDFKDEKYGSLQFQGKLGQDKDSEDFVITLTGFTG